MSRVIAQKKPRIELCILAGGLSERMGRDKARLRIGGRTMLAHIRATAAVAGLRVRVIRRDAVPRCGPLGGIITGFRRSGADALLFLACDMPFVTAALLQRILRASRKVTGAAFSLAGGSIGFPFLIPRAALAFIEQQRERGEYSLQQLAMRLDAVKVRVPANAVFNINTPEDFERVREGSGNRKVKAQTGSVSRSPRSGRRN